MSGRRSSRKGKSSFKPNSSNYLGYVEDEETPEMIERKFAILAELERKAKEEAATLSDVTMGEEQSPVSGAPLNEKQLEELFKETSMFSVDLIMDQNANGYYATWDDADDDSNDYSGYFSDEENFFGEREDEFFDDEYEDWDESSAKKKGKGRGPGVRPERKTRDSIMEVTGEDGYVYTIKKKIRIVDPTQPILTRVPPEPLTLSWAKMIKPYIEVDNVPQSSHVSCKNILDYDLVGNLKKTNIIAILMDPPWKVGNNKDDARYILPKQLEKLKIKSLIPAGYLFIWVEKEVIPDVVKVMERFEFVYVENLVWVKHTPNNVTVCDDYTYFRRSKASLLIFKKGEGIELRHQRNPDVVFDFVRNDKGLTEDKPDFVYHVIETLLPTSVYDESSQACKRLELWAKKGSNRKGWISVSQE